MSTSGIYINQLSRDDIINAAYRKLLVVGEGQTANANQITTGAAALNAITAEFRTLGMNIWARRRYYLTLITGQSQYVFGVGQVVNVPYPLRIYTCNLEIAPSFDSQIEMNQMSFTDFSLLPNGSTGVPVNMTYQPGINIGTLTVWPTPDASVPATTRIQMDFQVPFQYFTQATDTPDFPEEWNNALIYTLASTLSDEVGTPIQKQQWLEKQASKHLATALEGGYEEASWFFQPDRTGE